MKKSVQYLSFSAIIAALYVVLTIISAAFGLSSGIIQIRFSEALCVLPILTSSGIPGLFLGCILANIITGCALWDIVFGSLATLLGALGTRFLSQFHKPVPVCLIPPVLANTLIIPPVLACVYGVDAALPLLYLSVFAGEFISCFIGGTFLGKSLKKALKSVD